MTNFPRDDVIRAGGVAAHADRADQLAFGVVKRQATAKHIDAADLFAHERVVGFAVIFGRAFIGVPRVHRIAVLQAVERTAGLDCRIDIRRRERQVRQAERIGRIRLLRGDDAAARPLIAAIIAGEGHGANFPVAIHDRGPHVQAEAGICFANDLPELGLKLRMRRQVFARGPFALAAMFIVRGLRDDARKQHADTGSNNERGSHDLSRLLMVNPVRVQGHPKTAGCRGKRILRLHSGTATRVVPG